MKHGFIRVCAATPKIKVADVKYNSEQIIKSIKESYDYGSQLTVFPELCVCGYTCGDLFNQTALLDGVERAVTDICKATEGINALVFIGAPLRGENRSKLYNCAIAISNGKILGIVPKTYIPNYGEFYEGRHFSSAPKNIQTVKIGDYYAEMTPDFLFKAKNCLDFTVSAEICEDLWAPDSPSIRHVKAGANIIVNLSCSDEIVGKAE